MTYKTVRRKVSEDDFGDDWPLTVSHGVIELVNSTHAVFDDGATQWALNGAAQSFGYPEIEPIWKMNPALPGFRVKIAPLIEAALALGKGGRS